MNCPVDNSVMEKVNKNGITIDYCKSCQGIWLDRGELDKIIEQVEEDASLETPEEKLQREKQYPDMREGFVRGRRRRFLGDLFNFTGA